MAMNTLGPLDLSPLNARDAYNELSRKKSKLPPRKGVTAFDAKKIIENGDVFIVLTFHHGLGRMTRLDLGLDEIEPLVKQLRKARKGWIQER